MHAASWMLSKGIRRYLRVVGGSPSDCAFQSPLCLGFLQSFCSTPRQAQCVFHSKLLGAKSPKFANICFYCKAGIARHGESWFASLLVYCSQFCARSLESCPGQGVLSEGLFNALSLVCSLATHVEQGQDTSKPALLPLGLKSVPGDC